MKKFLLILSLLLTISCTTRTEFGECIGAFDEKQPDLIYKMSYWNLAMGIIFIETVVVPLVTVGDDLICPIGKRK